MFLTRLWATEPGRTVSNGANAEPNAGGQCRSQREDARLTESAARTLERGGEISTAGDH